MRWRRTSRRISHHFPENLGNVTAQLRYRHQPRPPRIKSDKEP